MSWASVAAGRGRGGGGGGGGGPNSHPAPPDGLKANVSNQIWNGREANPCIRCGSQDHALLQCTQTTGDSWKGRVWRDLTPKQVQPANDYVERFKPPPTPPTVSGPSQGANSLVSSVAALSIAPSNSTPAPLPPNLTMAKKNYSYESERKYIRKGNIVDVKNAPLQQRLSLVRTSKQQELHYPLREKLTDLTGDKVLTNHFEIGFASGTQLYQYKIKPAWSGMSKRKIRSVFESTVMSSAGLQANKANFATDFFDTIVAWPNSAGKNLGQLLEEKGCVRISGTGNGEPGTEWDLQATTGGRNPVPLSLKFEKVVELDSFLRYSRSDPQQHDWDKEPTVRALNIIIAKAFHESSLETTQVGANKFYVNDSHNELGGSRSLCSLRGYYYNLRPGFDRIILNLNKATSAFYIPQSVSQFLSDGVTWGGMNHEDVLRGLLVYIRYERGDKNDQETYQRLNTQEARTKPVCELGDTVARQTFVLETGQTMTVKNYLEQTYGRALVSPNMKAVNLGKRDSPRWYAPEHLEILPYQIYQRTVPDRLMQPMLTVACIKPNESRGWIEGEGLQAMGISRNLAGSMPLPCCPVLTINPSMLQIPSYKLAYPYLQYGVQRGSRATMVASGRWNHKGKQFHTTKANNTDFNVLVLAQKGLEQIPNFLKSCVEDFKSHVEIQKRVARFAFPPPAALFSTTSPADSIKEALQKETRSFNFILFILEQKNVEAYAALKNLADREVGVHSICLTRGVMTKSKPGDLYGNIAMKANLKATGSNHSVFGNGSNLQSTMRDTLVLGADVTHPGPSALMASPSIAAIVGSVDDHAGRFLGSMRLQSKDNEELIISVQSMVKERIKDWVLENKKGSPLGRMPTNILYYRDGVSEGQYSQVRDRELPQIKAAYSEVLAELQKQRLVAQSAAVGVNLTAIVVAKRHHVRFYPTPTTPHGELLHDNCVPGTSVEHVVTSPYFQDFYMQSHAAIKGTARPAHYFIIQEEMGKDVQFYRKLTHDLCYTYVRATVGVSYAAPAYYADRLCERGRQYLRDFYTNTQNDEAKKRRDEQKRQKREWEKEQKLAREKKYGAFEVTNADGKKVRRAKDNKELEQEREDQDAVFKKMQEYAMGEANKEFYKYKSDKGANPDQNPWHDKIAKTMFWM